MTTGDLTIIANIKLIYLNWIATTDKNSIPKYNKIGFKI